MTTQYQVLIVGGGPVGVALGVELGQRGISCAVIERNTSLHDVPKGQMLTQRTLEHFYFWNCVDELRAARVLPRNHPLDGITAYGDLRSRYWFHSLAPDVDPRRKDLYFQRAERLPQYLTEAVLRARLGELPAATVVYGFTATRVEQDDDGVQVTIVPTSDAAGMFYSWTDSARQDSPDDRGVQVLEADYVVGCDGGRSIVRESVGLETSGRDYEQKMVLAVFRSPEFHAGVAGYPDATTFRVLKPGLRGWWQFFGRIDFGEGFFFHSPVPAGSRLGTGDVHGMIEDAAGFRFSADYDHVGWWDARVMLATEYRCGRVFIVGDAGHQHPPYGGYGLNTGLEDARNLGWKLAARLQGWGGEVLLDSYGEERRPVFADVGERAIAQGIEHDAAFLRRYSPASNREEFETAWLELQQAASSHVQRYDAQYEGASVVCGPPDGVSGAELNKSHAAQPGHHLSPRWLSSGRNVFEELGSGFTLLALDADDGAAEAFVRVAAALKVPLKVIRDSIDEDRALYEARLILVRPDQYVAWRGDTLPDDAAQILQVAAGMTRVGDSAAAKRG